MEERKIKKEREEGREEGKEGRREGGADRGRERDFIYVTSLSQMSHTEARNQELHPEI